MNGLNSQVLELNQLTTFTGEIIKNLTSGMDLSKTIAQVSQLRTLLQSATNTDTGVLNFTKLNQAVQQANVNLLEYGRTLNSLGPTGQKAFQQLATAISKSEIPIAQTNGMLKQFGTTMKNTLRWQLSSSLLHGTVNAIQKAWNYAQKLDRSLTDIQIVTKQSDAQMAKFAENANRAARALSTSTTAYTDAALIYYQQGLNDAQVKQRTDVTVKMANVTGRTAEKVSDQMTAIWNNFDNGSKSLEYYADVITALGAATASSSDEIATGLSKFAAVADTVGLSYENATAALATITATTRQSADSVGNGLKTLFSRLQSLSLGQTLEDGVNLTKYTKALNTVGVSALDAAGNLRSMDSILADLGERWGTLSSAQQNALAQTVGGVRQYVTFTALMDNYDFFKDNIQIAKSAAGELQKQADVYDQSWAAARKHVQASAEAIYSDLIDDKFFTSLTNGFAGLLHQVDNFIDGIGGIKGVLLSAGAAFANFNKQGMQSFFQNAINGIQTFLPGGAEKLQKKRDETLDQFQNMLLNPTVKNAQGKEVAGGFTSLESRYRAEGIARNVRLQQDYLAKSPYMTDAQRLAAQMYMTDIADRGEEVAGLAAKVDRSQVARDDAQMAFRGFKNNKIPIKKVPTGQSRNQFVSDQMGQIMSTNESYQKLIGNTKDSFVRLEADLKASGIKSVLSGDALAQQAKALDKLLVNPNYKQYTEDLTILKDLAAGGDVKGYNFQMQNLFADKINVMREDAIDQVLKDMSDRGLFKGGTQEQQEARRAEAETSLRNVYKTTAQQLEDEARLKNTNGELDSLRTATLPDMLKQQFGTAQGLTEVSGMLMNLGMGLSTLKGALSTLKNDDIAAGDKAISLMTSVGFGLPMILKGYSDFRKSGLTSWLGESSNLGARITGSLLGSKVKGGQTLTPELMQSTAQTGGALAFGGYAAILAAIATGVVVAERSIVTAKERLDDLNQGLEWSKIRADEAKESYSNLLSGFDNHNKALQQLNELSIGTLEYRQKLLETNAATQELIDQYNISKDQYTIDRNGIISINATEQDKIAEEQLKKAEQAQTKYEVEKGMVATQQAYTDYQNFVKDYISTRGQANGYAKSQLMAQSYATGTFREYGYTSGEELIQAYENGELYDKIFKGQNVASPIVMGMRDSLNDKFPNGLNDIQSTLIDSIASDSKFQQQLLDENTINTRGIWAIPNSIQALSDRYAAQFGQPALEELQSSDEYKNATTRAQKRDILARAIENDEISKANLERFNKIWNLLSSPGTNAIDALSSWTSLNYTDFTNVITNLIESANTLDKDSAQIIKDFYGNVTKEYSEIISNFTSTFGQDSLKLGYSAAQMKDMNLQVKSYDNEFGVATRSFLISQLTGTGGASLLSNLKKIELSGNVIADMFNIKESGTILGKDLSAKLIETMKTDLGGDSGLFAELFSDSEFSSAFSDFWFQSM